MGAEESVLLTPISVLQSGVMDLAGLEKLLPQILEVMHCRELRELVDYVLRRMEQDTGFGLAQHGSVIVGITGSNHADRITT